MAKETEWQAVNARLPAAMAKQLKEIADKEHRSLSAQLVVAVERYLEWAKT